MTTVSIGHNNWLTINYGLNEINNFYIELNVKTELKKINFQQAADYTANLIAEKYSNIHVALSGGLDSEFVAKVFLRNNLNFTPVITITETNEHESWYAFKFCKENNLEAIILDFTSVKKHSELLRKILTKSIYLKVIPNVSLIPNIIYEYINAPILTGYGDFFNTIKINDLHISYKDTTDNLITIEEHDFYLQLESNIHPAPFFCYTPEIVVQMIKEIDISESLQIAKSKLYGVLPRPKFNNVLHHCLINNDIIKKIYIEKNNKNAACINMNTNFFLNLINNTGVKN